MYGLWIAATDTIVLDNKAVTKAVTHEQSSSYDLHQASYSLIVAKQLTVRWARGHHDPKKAHNLQDYQDRVGNELRRRKRQEPCILAKGWVVSPQPTSYSTTTLCPHRHANGSSRRDPKS